LYSLQDLEHIRPQNLHSGTETRILDFWDTGVTPGHVYNCAVGPFNGGFAPLMDILRMDGALMRSDGTMFRSTTNCDVGSRCLY